MTPGARGPGRGTGFAAPRTGRNAWLALAIPAILIVWLLALLTGATFGGWAYLLPIAALALAVRAVQVAFRGRYLTETSRKH
ncbi:MAG: hypothetical protein ABR524_00575 [Thermoanaerobaculia bacterium]